MHFVSIAGAVVMVTQQANKQPASQSASKQANQQKLATHAKTEGARIEGPSIESAYNRVGATVEAKLPHSSRAPPAQQVATRTYRVAAALRWQGAIWVDDRPLVGVSV